MTKSTKLKIGVCIYILLFLIDGNISYAQSEAQETGEGNFDTILNAFNLSLVINLVFAILVLFLTFLLSRVIPHVIVGRIEKHIAAEGGNGEEILGVISRLTALFILIIGISVAMTILGVDMTIFLGGFGFGVGFTLKVFLSNFVAGVIMVTQGTYHNGDLIKIEGNMGRIKKIYSLYTAVEQLDGVIYYVPNLKFLEENVSNYHSNDKRRIDVQALVAHDTDVYRAKQIMMQVVKQFPEVLRSPESFVVVDKLNDKGVLLTLRAWINSSSNYITMKSNLTETVNLAFRKSGINIPYHNITITNIGSNVDLPQTIK